MIDKKQIIQKIIQELQAHHETLSRAAQVAHDTASDEEFAAKSKYETFALEASYLASGQSKRVAELEDEILRYQQLPIKDFSGESIEVSALVGLEDEDGNQKLFFVGPVSGGLKIQESGKEVFVITPEAPLGELLMDRKQGDVFEFSKGKETIEYEIIDVS